jgi:hypothetical protein
MRQLFFLLSTLIANNALSQSSIPAKEAGKHIGEFINVHGDLYKSEIRSNKAAPDSASILLYLGDIKNSEPYFILIVKVNINNKYDAPFIKAAERKFKLGDYNLSTAKKKPASFEADGKIFMFEGKPAISINSGDLSIDEMVY